MRDAKGHEVIKADGNVFLLVDPDGSKPFSISFTVTVKTYSYKIQIAASSKESSGKQTRLGGDRQNLQLLGKRTVTFLGAADEQQLAFMANNDEEQPPEDIQQYLGQSGTIDPNNRQVKALAAKLKADYPIQTIHNILSWMNTNVKFKQDAPSEAVGDTIDTGNAHCSGYAALFAALCRATGIPTRAVRGAVRDNGEIAPPGHFATHSWVEVYLKGIGWVPVEPQDTTSLGRIGAGYIRLVHYGKKSLL